MYRILNSRKKILCVSALLACALPYGFSQNMLMAGGSYNLMPPAGMSAGAGFNMVINSYIQNDTLLAAGIMAADANDAPAFCAGVKDSLFLALNGRFIGLRLGVQAEIGAYFPDASYGVFGYIAALAGVWLFPRSLFSLTVDVAPGYLIALPLSGGAEFSLSGGLRFPVAAAVRLNLDRL